MRGRAAALRRIIELAGIGFGVRDEFLHGFGREVAAHQQHVRDRGHHRDRLERGRIEIELLVQERVDGERRRLRCQQRIAVGFRIGDRFRADIAGLAAAIFDHHRHVEFLPQPLTDDPRRGVDAAAGRDADDDLDGLARKIARAFLLRAGAGCNQQGTGRRNCQMFEHVRFPGLFAAHARAAINAIVPESPDAARYRRPPSGCNKPRKIRNGEARRPA